jgi:hypothetical protein
MGICIENECTLSSIFLLEITSNLNSRSLIGIIIVKHTVGLLYFIYYGQTTIFYIVHDIT